MDVFEQNSSMQSQECLIGLPVLFERPSTLFYGDIIIYMMSGLRMDDYKVFHSNNWQCLNT